MTRRDQDASGLIGASRSVFLESGAFLTSWTILGAFLGLFWTWAWTLLR